MKPPTPTSLSRATTYHKLLADRAFDIEFNGYLSNHVKHAIIALEKLDAPESRMQEYWDTYTAVTPYNLSLHPVTEPYDDISPVTQEQWSQLTGKKEKFWSMCKFLDEKLASDCNNDVDALVQTYAPDILPGLAGALTHGIIHLGWALDAYHDDTVPSVSPWMVLEGLAYLNFCNLPVDPQVFEHGAFEETTAVESLRRMARTWKQENLGETWITQAKKTYTKDSGFHAELIPAGFQWELSKVLDQPNKIMYQLPTWLDTMSLDDLWEELYKATVLVYLTTQDDEMHGNFLVLHLITSLWGLEHVLETINDENVSRKAIKCFYAAMVALLCTSTGGFPSLERIDDVVAKFGNESDADQAKQLGTTEWPEIVARAIPEEEEHNIKLVYVSRALWHRYNHWSGFREAANTFTLTPNIGPSAASFKA